MLRSRKNKSVVSLLKDRELNTKCSSYFISIGIISQLLRSDKKILYSHQWDKTTPRPITYDSGYLYFSDYTQYCSIYSKNYEVSPLCNMPKSRARLRISDVISYSVPVYKSVESICTCGSQRCLCLSQYVMTVSEDNFLCQHLMVDGKLIKEIYANRIGQVFRFKYIDWDIYGERFILTSILNPQLPRLASRKSGVVVNLAIFTVFPLEFYAVLEIKRSVFGENCDAVNVSDQHLILGLGQSQVKIYNFDDFLKQGKLTPYKLGQTYEWDRKVGSYPTGLPLNFTYDKAPPVLFNVHCSEQVVRFGGYPYHYIIKVPKRASDFVVRSVENNAPAVGGTFEMCAFNDLVDSVLFHPDNSNRLILKTDSSVDCYKLSNVNGVSEISKSFSMGFMPCKPPKPPVSSYGRKIKQRTASDFAFVFRHCTVFCTDYASDLDMFAVLGVQKTDSNEGFVKLYDSVTGEEVRTVPLKGRFCDSNFYELYVDMGSIIVVERRLPFEFTVYVCSL